jgi:hypothetical protein
MGKTRHLNGTCGQLESPSPSWFATEAANGNRLTPVYKKWGADPVGSRSLPQSSSASRFTAGAFGFLNLSQYRDRPLT